MSKSFENGPTLFRRDNEELQPLLNSDQPNQPISMFSSLEEMLEDPGVIEMLVHMVHHSVLAEQEDEALESLAVSFYSYTFVISKYFISSPPSFF